MCRGVCKLCTSRALKYNILNLASHLALRDTGLACEAPGLPHTSNARGIDAAIARVRRISVESVQRVRQESVSCGSMQARTSH